MMQDRYLVIAIVVIMAICCLGGYVAISGFLNSNVSPLSALTPGTVSTPIIVAVSTDTPAPIKPATTAPSAATVAPVPSPLGAFQTIAAAAVTQQPAVPTATPKPANPPTVAAAAVGQSCTGFSFCSKGGPPDFTLGPTSNCPSNYIWGRVVDKNGNGLPDMQIRWKLVSTGETGVVVSKRQPDTPGAYNITVQPGSSWVIWLADAGNQISPQVNIVTQKYSGSGDCPTRIDFVQQ